MNIKSKLKGNLAESVVKGVLSRCHYRVIPFGVEETLREVAVLNKDEYKEVRLPLIMRSMPDYVVASVDMKSVRLVEVKYRADWSREVRRKLKECLQLQVETWGEMLVVVLFREFLDEGPCIKCLHLQMNKSGETSPYQPYLEAVSPKGSKNWDEIEKVDFRELSDFFITAALDPSEFKDALRAIVSAEKGLSSTKKVLKPAAAVVARAATPAPRTLTPAPQTPVAAPRAAAPTPRTLKAAPHIPAVTPRSPAPAPRTLKPTPRVPAAPPRPPASAPRTLEPTPRVPAAPPRRPALPPKPRTLPQPLRPELPALPMAGLNPKTKAKP